MAQVGQSERSQTPALQQAPSWQQTPPQQNCWPVSPQELPPLPSGLQEVVLTAPAGQSPLVALHSDYDSLDVLG